MSSNTPNYNLIKPDPSDFYNIADFNSNADRIDTALGQKLNTSDFKTALDTHKSSTSQAQAGTDDTTWMTPSKVYQNFLKISRTRVSNVELNDFIITGEYALGENITVNGINFTNSYYGTVKVAVSNNIISQMVFNFEGSVYYRAFSSSASNKPVFNRIANPNINVDSIGIVSNLQTSVKTNLVAAVNEVLNGSLKVSAKSTTSQAQAGTDDSTYMTPAKVIQSLSVFGIGGNSAKVVTSGSYNDISVGGIYSISSAVSGGPNNDASTLLHLPNNANSAIQIDVTNSTNSMSVRSSIGGSWSAWDNISNNGLIGTLSALITTDKSNLVAAINEVKSDSLSASLKATTSQAQTGTDDVSYMTPLKSKQQLDYLTNTRRGQLTSADNLNNVYAAGMYALATDTLPTNMPAGASGYGVLIVSKGTLVDNANMTSQLYISHTTPATMYYRTASVTTWRDWVKVSTSAEIGLLSALQTSDKTSVVNAINSAYNDTLKLNAKASTAQAQTGTNDDTYMTPLKTKQQLDYAVSGIKATEAQAKAGTSNDVLMTPLRVNNVTGTLTNLQTTDKSSLVAAINENFTRVVNGKGLIATAINDMGGSASGSDSFQELADDIREIVPKYASGTIAVSAPLTPYSYYDASGTESMPSVIVSGLMFQPSRIVIIGTGGLSRITEYDFELGTLSESIRCSAYTGNRRDSGATYHFKNTGNAYVTNTGFKLPIISGSDNATWYAYE